MALAPYDGELWAEKRLELKRTVQLAYRTLADGEVQRLVTHQRKQRRVDAFDDAYHCRRILAAELQHGIRNDQHAGSRRDAERHGALQAATQERQLFRGLAQLCMDYTRARQECVPRPCQCDTAGIALKKLGMKLLFQLPEALRYCRLGDADLARRRAQASGVDYRKKVPDLVKPQRITWSYRTAQKCILLQRPKDD